MIIMALPENGRRLAPRHSHIPTPALSPALSRGSEKYFKYILSPGVHTKGGGMVVTYEGLFTFCLVIIGVIGLLTNRKK